MIAFSYCCTYVHDVRFYDPYCFERYLHMRGYERALGAKSINRMEDDYGVPELIGEAYDAENDRTFVTLYYDSRGIEVRCVGNGDLTNGQYDHFGYDIRTVAIHIKSDQYQFGRANIGRAHGHRPVTVWIRKTRESFPCFSRSVSFRAE